MQAQGYNKKDVIELEKQKAWAEGIGNMGSGSGGGAGGSTRISGPSFGIGE